MLATSQQAEAKIVYTPVHRIIDRGATYKLDLNHDGVPDFVLKNFVTCQFQRCSHFLVEQAPSGNSAVGVDRFRIPSALALRAGSHIGETRQFVPGAATLAHVYQNTSRPYTSYVGYWVNVTNRYLGLKFRIKGNIHFGWARLTVKVTLNPISVTSALTGYAYETVPKQGDHCRCDQGTRRPRTDCIF